MADRNDPWRGDRHRPRFAAGLAVWLGLIVGVGLVIWFLDDLFPGQIGQGNADIHAVKLVAILAVISSGVIFARRIRLGEAARNIAVWTGLAALLLVGYSFRAELEAVYQRVLGELVPSRAVALNDDELAIAASANGHFYVDGRANGQRVRFLIDTGASSIVLSPRDAARIGIDLSTLDFVTRVQTANGIGYGAPYRLDRLAIGPFTFEGVNVSVNRADMSESLLGIAFLDRLKSYEVRDGKLYLRR